MLVVILGGQGKTTAAQYLVREYGFECRTSLPKKADRRGALGDVVVDPIRCRDSAAYAERTWALGGVPVWIQDWATVGPETWTVPMILLVNAYSPHGPRHLLNIVDKMMERVKV